jgi:hypothetical protein
MVQPDRPAWAGLIQQSIASEWFDVDEGQFDVLEIRPTKGNFSYFFDTSKNQLVKQFLLHRGERVALICEVRLVSKGAKYSPRVRLSKVSRQTGKPIDEAAPAAVEQLTVKASVDTDGGHEAFVKLMGFVLGLDEVEAAATRVRVTDVSDAEILDFVKKRGRAEIVQLTASLLDSNLTDREIAVITGRKSDLELFKKLLTDASFFEKTRDDMGKGAEAVWQAFFEKATWIFGYGLSLVTHDGIDDGKLERITTGANLWTGAGKRSDAVMRSRAFVSTLLFCEIKRHDTPLLSSNPYRPPDVYAPSIELSGGVAQLQKTVRKTYRLLLDQIRSLTKDDGSPTGLDVSTTKPRQVLLIGDLNEFKTEHGINGEKVESFELFRRSQHDIEVITFDELYERARFIVES